MDTPQLYLLPVPTFRSILNPVVVAEAAAAAELSLPAWSGFAAGVVIPLPLPQSLSDSAQGQGRPVPSALVTHSSCKELYLLQRLCGETTSGPKVGHEEPPTKPLKAPTCMPVLHCTVWLLLLALPLHKHVVGFRKTSARFLPFLPHWNCRRL